MWRILGVMERKPPYRFHWEWISGSSLLRVRRKIVRTPTVHQNKMFLLAISTSRNSQLNSKIAFWVSLLTGKRYQKSCWIRTLKNSISHTMWTVWTVKRVSLQQDVSTVALASTFVLDVHELYMSIETSFMYLSNGRCVWIFWGQLYSSYFQCNISG